MAPTNRSRDTAVKKNPRRRRRPANTEQMYKCIDSLCGEECEQELLPVTDAASEYSDEDYQETRAPPTTKAAGRVGKIRPKRYTQEIPLKVGVYKAQQYICRALEFGVQSGYLTPKDSKGKVLVLSQELLAMSDAIRSRANAAARRAAAGESRRQTTQPQLQQVPSGRKRRTPEAGPMPGGGGGGGVEERDDEGDVDESRSRRRHGSRSRGRHGRKRSGRSGRGGRSRSRSRHRRSGGRRRPAAGGRSRSLNPDGEPRAKQNNSNKSDEVQQDALEGTGSDAGSANGGGSNGRIDNDNDDSKSVKSTKSGKSMHRGNDGQAQNIINNNGNGNANGSGSDEKKQQTQQQEQQMSDFDNSSEDEDKK